MVVKVYTTKGNEALPRDTDQPLVYSKNQTVQLKRILGCSELTEPTNQGAWQLYSPKGFLCQSCPASPVFHVTSWVDKASGRNERGARLCCPYLTTCPVWHLTRSACSGLASNRVTFGIAEGSGSQPVGHKCSAVEPSFHGGGTADTLHIRY